MRRLAWICFALALAGLAAGAVHLRGEVRKAPGTMRPSE